MILEIARRMHAEACRPYGGPRDPRLAAPFGTPPNMPPLEWLVSADVLQELYNASPPPVGPNPKNGDDGTRRLFGWPVIKDASLPAGTIRLNRAVRRAHDLTALEAANLNERLR